MFLGCFLGCYFGCVMAFVTIEAIKALKKEKVGESEARIAPRNINSLADPMELYRKYRDDKSNLYKPSKNKVVRRIEIGEDTE